MDVWSLTMLQSDRVQVNLHPLHPGPGDHRLELIHQVLFGEETVPLLRTKHNMER